MENIALPVQMVHILIKKTKNVFNVLRDTNSVGMDPNAYRVWVNSIADYVCIIGKTNLSKFLHKLNHLKILPK